jgi:signal transduction histidine kinase
VDLSQLAHETVRFLEMECERAHVLTRVECESDVAIDGSASEFEQLVLNLCMNAIQAQPSGGRLEVRVTRGRDAAHDRAVLTVRDAGPGVPDDLRERIFEAFFTTKREGEGTGLGLAICDEIVRRHGGTIVVANGPEGGAEFRVLLPLADEQPAGVLSGVMS